MTFRTQALAASAAAATAATAIALLALGGPRDSPAANPRARPGAVETGCAQQSGADFPGAYRDRRNLVVGPLALIGGATFTDAVTARRFHGNKYPLLVRVGHTVTVSVPPGTRRTASLGYGPLPDGHVGPRDGHHTVTFVACSPNRVAGSTADGPVTFWSGFVMVSEPACVPLDVYVDGAARPRRVTIELGRRCAKPLRCATARAGSRAPSPPMRRRCPERSSSGRRSALACRPASDAAATAPRRPMPASRRSRPCLGPAAAAAARRAR